MAKGRPKKSELKKNLHGTSRKDRKNKQIFTASDSKFGIPHGLSLEVRQKVRQMAHNLEDAGAPIEFLRPTFERYCWHLQITREAWLELKGKPTIKDKKNPAAQIFKDNSDAAGKLEQYFRKILENTEPKVKKKDPLSEFQKRGKALQAVK